MNDKRINRFTREVSIRKSGLIVFAVGLAALVLIALLT